MTGQAQGGLGGGALVPGETQADGCEWDPRVVRSGRLVYLLIVSDPSERMLGLGLVPHRLNCVLDKGCLIGMGSFSQDFYERVKQYLIHGVVGYRNI